MSLKMHPTEAAARQEAAQQALNNLNVSPEVSNVSPEVSNASPEVSNGGKAKNDGGASSESDESAKPGKRKRPASSTEDLQTDYKQMLIEYTQKMWYPMPIFSFSDSFLNHEVGKYYGYGYVNVNGVVYRSPIKAPDRLKSEQLAAEKALSMLGVIKAPDGLKSEQLAAEKALSILGVVKKPRKEDSADKPTLNLPPSATFSSYKSALQEYCQKLKIPIATFSPEKTKKGFMGVVSFANVEVRADIAASSKKEADSRAAFNALKQLEYFPADMQYTPTTKHSSGSGKALTGLDGLPFTMPSLNKDENLASADSTSVLQSPISMADIKSMAYIKSMADIKSIPNITVILDSRSIADTKPILDFKSIPVTKSILTCVDAALRKRLVKFMAIDTIWNGI